MTNVSMRGESSSVSDDAGDRALAGDHALGEVGGVLRITPAGPTRHSIILSFPLFFLGSGGRVFKQLVVP